MRAVALFLLAAGAAAGQEKPDPAARAAVLARSLASAEDAKAFEKTLEEARALLAADELLASDRRDQVQAQLADGLKANKARFLKAIDAKAKSAGFKQLKALRAELDRRRQAALKLIFDEKVYVREDHPDWRKGDKANGQEKVDQLVLKRHKGSVQELWEGAALVVAIDAALRKAVERVRLINEKLLAEFGAAGDDELKAYPEVVWNTGQKAVDLRSFALSEAEAALHSWNRRVDRYNEALAGPDVGKDEKEHARILNDYREMMGRRRLFLDPRLCRASRKHSAVCNAAGRIWHEGPDGTPQTRAKAEGFPAGVGENVALGLASPGEIWWSGWYKASDHHRNALREEYTCLGYGYAGRVGTQNFGGIEPPKGFPEK